ncbi:WD40-repeat-containing domain protein [Phascolomyces articulosus]|uniref:WD40-repeat-containing domain protein n=1 Tax=Phascolomyces articulosus TaxID=60185 RepID=A0AAD5K1U5_9FUNG|nr:WD40-repeat-containing domain protein [Phascolomyces articulosus]
MLMEDLPPCQAYPPVPNWYTSHCAAVSDPNYYVYATRNTIVVLDLSSFRFVRAFIAAKDKIQAIAAHQQFCFAGGADNVIRAWSLSNGSLLMTYNVHSTEVTVIKCIRDGKILVSGDKSGKVVLQEPFNKKRYTINKISSEVRTIAPLHHAGDDYLAVGS